MKQQLKLLDNPSAAGKSCFSFVCFFVFFQISTIKGRREAKPFLFWNKVYMEWSFDFYILKAKNLRFKVSLRLWCCDAQNFHRISDFCYHWGNGARFKLGKLPGGFCQWHDVPELEQLYYAENYDISEFENFMPRIY